MEVPVKDAPSGAENPAPSSQPPVTEAATAQPAGVMDIKPPQTPATPPPAEAPKNEAPAQPPEAKGHKEPKPVKATVPKKPHQPGIGMAIAATIVIVFGLAGMAVYAYLKTQ